MTVVGLSRKAINIIGEITRDMGIGIEGGAMVAIVTISQFQYWAFIIAGALFIAVGATLKFATDE